MPEKRSEAIPDQIMKSEKQSIGTGSFRSLGANLQFEYIEIGLFYFVVASMLDDIVGVFQNDP